MQCPTKKFQMCYSITKPKRTVSELFFRLKYSCMNSAVSILQYSTLYFYLISVFLHTVLYFIKKWFIVINFTLPRLFRNPAISNFFSISLSLATQHAHKQDIEYCRLFVQVKNCWRKNSSFVFLFRIRSLWQDWITPSIKIILRPVTSE